MELEASTDLAHRPADGPLVVTTDSAPGYRVARVIGLVRGNTIRARHFGNDILAALRTLVGGEITEYTQMMAASREQALDRLRAEAVARGANGVLGVRFTTSTVMAGAAEILAYGTAVVLEPERPEHSSGAGVS
jgi:uncharacterized protein YbjQ (UPF0145 family)